MGKMYATDWNWPNLIQTQIILVPTLWQSGALLNGQYHHEEAT